MMRLKPSVSSRSSSSAAGFSLIAASAMRSSTIRQVASLFSEGDASIQIIRVFLHMFGKAERVVAHQILGALGVARLERLDDVDVIADRAVDAILLADGLAADHAHVGEQVCRQT